MEWACRLAGSCRPRDRIFEPNLLGFLSQVGPVIFTLVE
jgi:hypothetical protein